MTQPAELAAPVAKRLQRPSWRDSRLVVGLLLVVLSATLGAKAVASADDRVPVWVAATDLVAGDEVGAGSFVRADVQLADGVSPYLSADAPAPVGSFVVRDLRAGELVPASAVGAAELVGVQRLTLRADSASTSGLVRGARVDVYVTPPRPSAGDARTATTRVLEGAGVAGVQTSGSGFGADSTTSVQVYVPSAKVQALVEAVDSEARITLVPTVGAPAGGGA